MGSAAAALKRRISNVGLPPRALDQLDAVAVRIPDEAEPRAALAHGVRGAFRLDALLGEARERAVQIVHGDGDVAVAGSKLVGIDAEVVGQLEARAVSGEAHEDVDRLLANRHAPQLLEAERGV